MPCAGKPNTSRDSANLFRAEALSRRRSIDTMAQSPWILTSSRVVAQPSLDLYCIAYAGSGASTYAAWGASFPAHIRVLPIQFPGRENRLREPLEKNLKSLAEAIGAGIAPLLQNKFAIFGHSFGGLVAFELTRWLRRSGLPAPVGLMLSSQAPPRLPRNYPQPAGLSDLDFLRLVDRRYGGIPELFFSDAQFRELYLPILKADFTALCGFRYESEVALDCPLSLFGGAEDPTLSAAESEGWRIETTGAVHSRIYPGGHFYLKSQRERLIADIVADLEVYSG